MRRPLELAGQKFKKKTRYRPLRITLYTLLRNIWHIGIFRILGWLLFSAAVLYMEWLI